MPKLLDPSKGIRFDAVVRLANTDIAGITLAGGTITHGANAPGETPTPSTAYLTLITTDANGALVDAYPEMGWGDRVPSGFEETYVDYYEGGSARIAIGAPVRVAVVTPTGFVDEYVDGYVAGFESTRFVGTVTAIDYRPATVNVTAIADSERLTRVKLNASAWPAESEVDRVTRIATDAGIAVEVVGESTATIAKGRDGNYASAFDLLRKVADDCDALFYTTRGGVVTYRTRDAVTGKVTVDLEPSATDVDSLTMTQEAGRIVNAVTVEYPDPNGTGNLSTTVEDQTSIARYGRRERNLSVELAPVDAIAKANRVLTNSKDATWLLPVANYILPLLRDLPAFPENVGGLLDVDLDDEVRLPVLLPGSPVESYTSRVVGWVETLSRTEWAINWTLDPYGWTNRLPGDTGDYIPPPTAGPSKDPVLTPSGSGEFAVVNFDGNLTYVASPIGGTTATATLDSARGRYTISGTPAAFSVTTTEPGSKPGSMERRPYTYHSEDHGYWREYVVEVDESYPARQTSTPVKGDTARWDGNGWACPPGWNPVQDGDGAVYCWTVVYSYVCDYGGTLEGTTCRKVRQEVRREWVSNVVQVKDPTPEGFYDVFGEWMRGR